MESAEVERAISPKRDMLVMTNPAYRNPTEGDNLPRRSFYPNKMLES